MDTTNYQYCADVPFRKGVKYCYPEVDLDSVEVITVGMLWTVVLIILIAYARGKLK